MDFKFLFSANEKESINNLQRIGAMKDCLINEELKAEYLDINKEKLPVLLVLDSILTIREMNTEIKVHIEDYLREYKNNAIEQVITKCENGMSAYKKINTNIDRLKSLSSAVYLELDGNKIKKYKAAIGGSDMAPFRLYEIENLATGKGVDYLNKEKTLNIIMNNIIRKIRNRYNENIDKNIVQQLYRDTLNNALNRFKEKID